MIRSRRKCWLDRIRTAKGLSEPQNTELQQNNNNPIASDPNRKRKNNDEAAAAEMSVSDVIHDLFNFGNPNTSISNKSSRKQSNPTFYRPTTINTFPINHHNNNNTSSLCLINDDDDDADDLPGFSKTEVTIIDTSYQSWKFDKLLFRKNNVWKVGHKHSDN